MGIQEKLRPEQRDWKTVGFRQCTMRFPLLKYFYRSKIAFKYSMFEKVLVESQSEDEPGKPCKIIIAVFRANWYHHSQASCLIAVDFTKHFAKSAGLKICCSPDHRKNAFEVTLTNKFAKKGLRCLDAIC